MTDEDLINALASMRTPLGEQAARRLREALRDCDALRSVVEELQVQLAIAELRGVS